MPSKPHKNDIFLSSTRCYSRDKLFFNLFIDNLQCWCKQSLRKSCRQNSDKLLTKYTQQHYTSTCNTNSSVRVHFKFGGSGNPQWSPSWTSSALGASTTYGFSAIWKLRSNTNALQSIGSCTFSTLALAHDRHVVRVLSSVRARQSNSTGFYFLRLTAVVSAAAAVAIATPMFHFTTRRAVGHRVLVHFAGTQAVAGRSWNNHKDLQNDLQLKHMSKISVWKEERLEKRLRSG